MRVLIACEFSQVVTRAFRDKGHEAYSCDILPTEGNPEWHIQGDVLKHLDDGWDLMIAHPPCTYLSLMGARWYSSDPTRLGKTREARTFFMKFINANIYRICVENPLPIKLAKLPHYSQIIHPRYFGDFGDKRTCLWLKNLPPLMSTYIYPIGERYVTKDGRKIGSKWFMDNFGNAHERSRSFPQIAQAMATQWSEMLRRK